MYKKVKHPDGFVLEDVIVRLSDGAYIFFGEDNPNYKDYLKWLAEGNEPLPADE